MWLIMTVLESNPEVLIPEAALHPPATFFWASSVHREHVSSPDLLPLLALGTG